MNAKASRKRFKFKQFELYHHNSSMKVGTDGVLLGAWANVKEANNILDVGTGCGLIALMAAQRNSEAHIDAIDIDRSSVQEANTNFELSPWKHRMNAIESSIQDFNHNLRYDHILSNPPFFLDGTSSPVDKRHKARHTITLPVNELIEHAVRLLNSTGKLSVIIPTSLEQQLIEISLMYQLHLIKRTLFYSKRGNKPERSLLCLSKTQQSLTEDTLIHYNSDGAWTDDYKNLTSTYHINL